MSHSASSGEVVTSPLLSLLHWSTLDAWWLQICDPYLQSLPLFGSPYAFASIFAFIVILITSVTWTKQVSLATTGKVKAQHLLPSVDIRPLQLIHDGFLFGVYGIAIPMYFSVSEFGPLFFTCHRKVIVNDYVEAAGRHLLYTYLLLSYVHYLRPLIQALANVQLDIGIDLIHHTVWSNVLIVLTAANPVGRTLLIPVIDSFVKVFHYGTSVLLVSQNQEPIKSKINELARAIGFSLMTIQLYRWSLDSCNCKPPYASAPEYKAFLFVPVAVYTAIISLYSLLRFVSRSGVTASSLEKQVLSASGKSLRSSVKLTKLPVTLVK